MRFLVSISLSALLLLQSVNFGVGDFMRFDDLIEHAQLHSNLYGDSFLDFINKHYGELKEDHNASHEGHESLPFNHESAKATAPVFVLSAKYEFEIECPPLISLPEIFSSSNSYTSLVDENIFQPPKSA